MFYLDIIPAQGKIIDITTPISPFTQVYPGDPKVVIEKVCILEKEGCAVSKLTLGSHTSTHVDAPSHVLNNGLPVDKLKLEDLMGIALVLDFSSFEGSLTAKVLKEAFQSIEVPENTSILLLKTINPAKKQKDVENTNNPNEKSGKEEFNPFEFCPVYLEESAAAWIVEKEFKTVGIDSFSVDYFHSETLPSHHILLSENVNIVECLELSSVDAGIYFFLCLPLKIEGCDGAPARALLISYS